MYLPRNKQQLDLGSIPYWTEVRCNDPQCDAVGSSYHVSKC